MSGTDIMVHSMNCGLLYLHQEHGFPLFRLSSEFACDNDKGVQAYLADQFPELPCLVNTVKELSEYK